MDLSTFPAPSTRLDYAKLLLPVALPPVPCTWSSRGGTTPGVLALFLAE
jgi:hypothetical protein